MSAYGNSGQGYQITIGGVGPLYVTKAKLRKNFVNADTTVTGNEDDDSDGWSQLCPIYRDWYVDVEMPLRSADASDTIIDAFDDDAFSESEDPDVPSITIDLPGDLPSYSGDGMLDGELVIDDSAKDAVRLTFTIKGTGPLTSGD